MIVDLSKFADVAGTCDLLRAITYGVAAANLASESELLVHHEPMRGCPDSMLDLVRVEGIELKACTVEKLEADPDCIQLNSFSSFPSPAKLPAGMEDPAGFYQLWKKSYQKLKPTPQVETVLDDLGLDSACIGLHIRLTDKSTRKPDEHEIHERKVNKVLRQTRHALIAKLEQSGINRVYLACDSEASVDYWSDTLTTHGIEIIRNPMASFSSSSFRQTSGTDFMIDLFALSRCDHLIASTNSGVPVTAALINGTSPGDIIWGRYYRPLRSLESNMKFLHKRRAKSRRATLKGKSHCPTLAFLD